MNHLNVALSALRAPQEAKSPCAACGYGGKHLDAPPCANCPAYPKGEKNEPLTLDELKNLSGQPIFLLTGQIVYMDQLLGCWEILEEYAAEEDGFWFTRRKRPFLSRNYMKTWAAYLHPPKGAEG